MKISIDTAQDSKDEIRKAIRLLQALVEHEPGQGSKNLFESPSNDLFGSSSSNVSSPASAFGSLFGDDAKPPASAAEQETQEKEEEKPQVEFY